MTLADTGAATMTGGRIARVAPLHRGRHLPGHLRRRPGRRRHPRPAGLPPLARPARDGHGRPPRVAVRRARARRRRPGRPASPRSPGSTAGSTPASSSSTAACFDYLGGDDCILEREPLERLADEGELMAYRHDGFFYAMDTLPRVRGCSTRSGIGARPRGKSGARETAVMGSFWRDRPTLVTGATGLVGGWLVAPTARGRGRRRLPRPRLACRRALLVRCGPDRPRQGRPRRRPRPGAARARARRVRGRHRLPPRRPDDRRHRQPQPGLDLRVQHPGDLGPARSLPPLAAGQAGRRWPRPTRRTATSRVLPYDETMPLQGRHPYDVSKSCADLIAADLRRHLRPARRDHPLRQLLRRRRPELEPDRPRHDPLGPPRPAARDPLRRHVRSATTSTSRTAPTPT